MSHIVEKWNAFCEWQKRPSLVAAAQIQIYLDAM